MEKANRQINVDRVGVNSSIIQKEQMLKLGVFFITVIYAFSNLDYFSS